MMPELRQIDQDLIKLLGQRIAVLKAKCFQETTADTTQLLAESGVPEFLWRSLVTSCTAAIAATALSPTQVKPRQVTVIGGQGMMGGFFTQQLTAAGHNVKTLGRNDWGDADQLLGEAELVLVCVPIEHTLAVIQKAAQYLTPAASSVVYLLKIQPCTWAPC